MRRQIMAMAMGLFLAIGCATTALCADEDSLVVTDSGNVGIGTTTPNQKLQVEGPQETFFSIIGKRENAWTASGMVFGDEFNNGRYLFTLRGTKQNDNGDFKMYYYTTDPVKYSEPLCVSPVSNNSPDYKLSLHNWDFQIGQTGNIGIGTAPATDRRMVIKNEKRADGIAILPTDGRTTKLMLLNDIGNGSWNPLSKDGDNLLLCVGSTMDNPDAGGMVIGPWSAQNKGVRIAPDGNVGIGTPDPSEKLEVAGSIKLKTENSAVKFNDGTELKSRFPKPDFDSGWFTMTPQCNYQTVRDFQHNFNCFPVKVKAYYLMSNGFISESYVSYSYSKSIVKVGIPPCKIVKPVPGDPSPPPCHCNYTCKVRVLAWKGPSDFLD